MRLICGVSVLLLVGCPGDVVPGDPVDEGTTGGSDEDATGSGGEAEVAATGTETTGSEEVGEPDTHGTEELPPIEPDTPDVPTDDEPPSVSITAPAAQAVFEVGAAVAFSALVTDDKDAAADLSAVWSSSNGGELSTGAVNPAGIASFQSSELAAGPHTITLMVTDTSGNVGTDTVEIKINTLPTAPVIALTPTAPRTSDALTVSVVEPATDADGDELTTEIVWSLGGEATAHTGLTIPPDDTAKGQTWTVTVRAKDAVGYGPSASAEAVVLNTPPICGDVTLGPDEPVLGATLTCGCAAVADPDSGDAVTASCGYAVGEGAPTEGPCEEAPVAATKGQSVTCELTLNDGEDAGPPASSDAVVVANSAPTLSLVTLTGGDACATWTCAATSADADNDPLSHQWRWEVDGEDIGVTTATLGAYPLQPDQQVQCYAKASDGDAETAEVASNVAVVAGPDFLPIVGLFQDNMGFVGWNTVAQAPEAEKFGHTLPTSLICDGSCPNYPVCQAIAQFGAFAFYYVASRDHDDWGDGLPASPGSFRTVAGGQGFDSFTAALAENGFTFSDVVMRHGVHTLGADQEGADWSFDGPLETRAYTGGTWTLMLDGQPMVGASMPDITNTLDYKAPCNLDDDLNHALTDWTLPQDQSQQSSAAVQAVAAAFLADTADGGIRFNYQARLPAVQTQINGNKGRYGNYIEVPNGFIQRPGCQLGAPN